MILPQAKKQTYWYSRVEVRTSNMNSMKILVFLEVKIKQKRDPLKCRSRDICRARTMGSNKCKGFCPAGNTRRIGRIRLRLTRHRVILLDQNAEEETRLSNIQEDRVHTGIFVFTLVFPVLLFFGGWWLCRGLALAVCCLCICLLICGLSWVTYVLCIFDSFHLSKTSFVHWLIDRHVPGSVQLLHLLWLVNQSASNLMESKDCSRKQALTKAIPRALSPFLLPPSLLLARE